MKGKERGWTREEIGSEEEGREEKEEQEEIPEDKDSKSIEGR